MANKKINELQSRVPSLTDLMLVGDPSSGYSYRCTVHDIANIIEGDIGDTYVTLTTTQTISGAKTFSNNLTLTSVTNASVDTDKFLVLNASNIVNFRTGSEVLSDIGGQGTISLTTSGTSGAATFSSNTLNIPQYQGAITLTTTGTSGAATLVGNTLNIPNYAPDLSGYVPTSRTITINGTTQDLSANRTYNVGTVTSVGFSAGTGISLVIAPTNPITSSGTVTITNSAPDQVVALTAGTGISVSGTYPNFTITNLSPSLGGTVTSVALSAPTGFSVTGSPVTTSGTLGLTFASGYSLPTTASQVNWDSAYNNMIVSAAVTGTTTKTLTLTQQDAGTITASWTDNNTDAVTSVFGRTGAVVAVSGDYTTAQVTESGNLYYTDARARAALSAGTGISYSSTTGVISSTITQYTDALARAAISLTTTGSSGAATYSSSTGVLNVPTYTLTGLGGVPTSRTITINGTAQDLSTDRTFSVGTVTSVAATAGTGISISGSPITSSGTLTITNTAPDQVVALTAGTGISTSGTYPNFTITNSAPDQTVALTAGSNITITGTYPSFTIAASGGSGSVTSVALTTGTTGTDISVSGSPITTSGTFTLNIPTASATNRGALSSTDWTTFNNKQNALTLTTTGTSGAATLVGATLNIPQYQSVLTNPVTGTGTTNYVTKFTGTSTIGNSVMQEATSNIGIGGSPSTKLDVFGTTTIRDASATTTRLEISPDSDVPRIDFVENDSYRFSLAYRGDAAPASQNIAEIKVLANAPLAFSTNSSERMRLTSGGSLGIGTTTIGSTLQVNGNAAIGYSASTAAPTNGLAVSGSVGIGTTSPSSLLNASASTNSGSGSTYPLVTVSNTLATQGNGSSTFNFSGFTTSSGNGAVQMYMSTSYASGTWEPQGLISVSTNHPLIFRTNNTERMRITSGGNVGIGTSNPQGVFEAVGLSYFTRSAQSLLINSNYAGANTHIQLQAVQNVGIAFATNGDNERMRITSGGNVGIGTTSPTSTLHTNGSVATAYSSKTATYTLTGSDYTVLFNAVGAGANLTANLPDATTCTGRIYVIIGVVGGSTTNVTIDGNGTQTIGGSQTYTFWNACETYGTLIIQSDGSNWQILSQYIESSGC